MIREKKDGLPIVILLAGEMLRSGSMRSIFLHQLVGGGPLPGGPAGDVRGPLCGGGGLGGHSGLCRRRRRRGAGRARPDHCGAGGGRGRGAAAAAAAAAAVLAEGLRRV